MKAATPASQNCQADCTTEHTEITELFLSTTHPPCAPCSPWCDCFGHDSWWAGAGDGGAVAVAEAELPARPMAAVVDPDARAFPQARSRACARGDEQLGV